MNFSRHQRQHLQQHMTHFTRALSAPCSFTLSSTHSRRTRSILTKERTREPNAMVPRWNLRTRPRLRVMPTVSMGPALSKVQYQPDTEPASTISPSADMKNSSQNSPNKL